MHTSATISADRKLIQQILWNIILNGMQAIQISGELIITTSHDNSEIIIHISDNGKGISPETLPHIFEPFYTTKHKGTGLGMTISKRIIEQHKGRILIVSKVNEGTEVTIILPKLQ